jgi:hypothetical protein
MLEYLLMQGHIGLDALDDDFGQSGPCATILPIIES